MRTFLRLFVLTLPQIVLFVITCFLYGIKIASLVFVVCGLIVAFIGACVVLAQRI